MGVWEESPRKLACRVQNGVSLEQPTMWNINREVLFLLTGQVFSTVCQRKPQKALQWVNWYAPSCRQEGLATGELVCSKLPLGRPFGGWSRRYQIRQGSQRKEKWTNSGDKAQKDGTGCDVWLDRKQGGMGEGGRPTGLSNWSQKITWDKANPVDSFVWR